MHRKGIPEANILPATAEHIRAERAALIKVEHTRILKQGTGTESTNRRHFPSILTNPDRLSGFVVLNDFELRNAKNSTSPLVRLLDITSV